MIPTPLMPVANHLWQSSLFAVAAALLSLILRRDRASLRFWVWFAASVKFLIPFSLLIRLGSVLQPTALPVLAPTPVSFLVREVSQPFALPVPAPFLDSVPEIPSVIPMALAAIWFCGFAVSAWCWLRSWLRVRATVRGARETQPHRADLRVMESAGLVEPCVFGIFRPVLLLPRGLRERLTAEQLEAIFLHEICHVRRHDNLTAAVHLVVETVFWFYPLTYWIGKRLMDERESACDDEVLRRIARPEAYAKGILAVCRFGLQASPACAAGVGGSDLKRRIESIMGDRAALTSGTGRKALLAAAAITALVAPFVAGVFFVRSSSAQTPGRQAFGVAVIKPNPGGSQNSGFRKFRGGELDALNITLKMLISFAYDIPEERILQGPGWLDSERYDILAKPEASGGKPEDPSMRGIRLRTQTLLADRFQVTLHKETRQLPIFILLADKGGPKNLMPPKGREQDLINNGHHVTCTAASMEFFAKVFLTEQLGGPVLDQTGIKGNFDFTLDWAGGQPGREALIALDPQTGEIKAQTNAGDLGGASLFGALREQLGLRVKGSKGPVEVLIVDRAEKPSEN